MVTLGSKITAGAAWMVLLRIGVRIIGLISTLILVRLLEPSDFGIVAMAMSIFAVIELLTAFSFDVAIIQNQEAGDDEYNAAWTLNVLLGVFAATVLLLLAYPAAGFYDEPRLAAVISVLALSAIFQGAENIGLVEFRKFLTFHKEFIFQFAVKIAAFVTTVSLALLYRTYWALVAGIVVSKAAGAVLSYFVHPYRPHFSLKAVSSIFDFSKWLFINNIIFFCRYRAPDFIVGKISGTTGLGLFSVAYEISNLPTTELIAPINRALLPGFSQMTTASDRMSRGLAKAAATLALVSIPAGIGIAATADLLVPVLLGSKWMAAVPLIEILALFGAIGAVQSPIGTALIALGKPNVVALLSLSSIVVMLPLAIFLTGAEGPVGMAKALLGSSALFLPLTYGIAARYVGLTISDIISIFFRPAVAALAMYFGVKSFTSAVMAGADTIGDQSIVLGAAVVLGATIYSAIVTIVWLIGGRPDGAERYVLDLLKSRFQKSGSIPV
jgi:O-antigen/teichoic acid export membrane protein